MAPKATESPGADPGTRCQFSSTSAANSLSPAGLPSPRGCHVSVRRHRASTAFGCCQLPGAPETSPSPRAAGEVPRSLEAGAQPAAWADTSGSSSESGGLMGGHGSCREPRTPRGRQLLSLVPTSCLPVVTKLPSCLLPHLWNESLDCLVSQVSP